MVTVDKLIGLKELTEQLEDADPDSIAVLIAKNGARNKVPVGELDIDLWEGVNDYTANGFCFSEVEIEESPMKELQSIDGVVNVVQRAEDEYILEVERPEPVQNFYCPDGYKILKVKFYKTAYSDVILKKTE